jgi:hypothetical protein
MIFKTRTNTVWITKKKKEVSWFFHDYYKKYSLPVSSPASWEVDDGLGNFEKFPNPAVPRMTRLRRDILMIIIQQG